MKWTTVSIGGLAAAALLAVALWPEGANLKLTPKAAAQPAATPAAVPAAAKEDGKTKEDNNAATEAALSKQIAAEFVETPLNDVISYLQDLTGVEFYLNAKKLEEAGFSKDAPITVHLKKVRVDMLLDLALAQAGDGVAYVLRDGIVVVSSASDLENATEVRVYNCRDLLKLSPPVESGFGPRAPMPKAVTPSAVPGTGGFGPAGPAKPIAPGALPTPAASPAKPGALGPAAGEPAATPVPGGVPALPGTPAAEPPAGPAPGVGGLGGIIGGGPIGHGMGGLGGGIHPAAPLDESSQRAERLMHIITTAVTPDSWMDAGGFGTIAEYNGLMVVNHNARTHRQIEKVLSMLREAAAKDVDAPKAPAPGKK